MRILLVDDDPLILNSLELKLKRESDIEIVGCANNGKEAIDLCKECQPDVVLMDIRMPEVDGINATRRIKENHPGVKIMMLTTFDDRPNIQQALAAGADGYILKTDKISGIAGKLRVMMDGMSILGTDVLKKLAPTENPELKNLTKREMDITRLVAQGKTNKDIAAELFVSEGTVRNNIVVIMEKLNVTNRTQLGLMYFDR